MSSHSLTLITQPCSTVSTPIVKVTRMKALPSKFPRERGTPDSRFYVAISEPKISGAPLVIANRTEARDWEMWRVSTILMTEGAR